MTYDNVSFLLAMILIIMAGLLLAAVNRQKKAYSIYDKRIKELNRQIANKKLQLVQLETEIQRRRESIR